VARQALPGPVNELLLLVSSELVTNAVLHAATPLTLGLELHSDRVRVCVEDQSPALPAVRHVQPDAPTGRGLVLVAESSRGWGVDQGETGKTVWAEIDLPTGVH